MVGKKEEIMESNDKKEREKILLSLEEYIPLKIIFNENDEPIRYISYYKDKKSLLEISVGITSGLIRRITLLLSKEYDIIHKNLNINFYETGDLRLNDESKKICSHFITYLYEDGVRIVVSEDVVEKYIKVDRLYIGWSKLGNIVEICLCQLNLQEINHIKKELSYQ